jgi:hypothetical protein
MAFIALCWSFRCERLIVNRHLSKWNPSEWLATLRFMHVEGADGKKQMSDSVRIAMKLEFVN